VRQAWHFLIVLCALAVATTSAPGASAYQVPTSIPADCSVDVTQPILSWIASVPNNSTLSFGAGCYRVEGTLQLTGRSGLDFEGNGATFRSFSTPAPQRAIWRAIASSGLVFHNMTIQGSYANGGVHDPNLQWAHAIDLRGTSAEVANVTMTDVAGDCVYFGLGYDSVTPSSGSVHDSTCLRNGRNAVSVTAGKNILVQRMTTDKIGYTAFDVEPDYNVGAGSGSDGVTFDSNTIGSYYLYAYAIVENAPNHNETFSNNRLSGQPLRIGIVNPGSHNFRPQSITIDGNSATLAQWAPAIDVRNVDGITITGNTIPMTSGAMAALDNTCGANVSGDTYTGGSTEVSVTNVPTSCSAAAAVTPVISSFAPTLGAAGTPVTISGSNLGGATAVQFNGTSATFTQVSTTQITTNVPAGATTGPISVTTAGGKATSSASFSVPAPSSTSAPPANTLLPVVSGTLEDGQTLTVTNGTWNGGSLGFSYQWTRCNTSGVGCVSIPAATAARYTATTVDVGATLRATVTASNAAGSAVSSSDPTKVVAPAPSTSSAPSAKSAPTISGGTRVGKTLTISAGSWAGSPTSYAYQWLDCDPAGANCAAIAGAAGATYTVATADCGDTIRATVTATNAVGRASATSNATAPIRCSAKLRP
jgi:hypothetical protein